MEKIIKTSRSLLFFVVTYLVFCTTTLFAEVKRSGNSIVIDNGILNWSVDIRHYRYARGNAYVLKGEDAGDMGWGLSGVFPYGIYPATPARTFWKGNEDYLKTEWKTLCDDEYEVSIQVTEELVNKVKGITTYRMYRGDKRVLVSAELIFLDEEVNSWSPPGSFNFYIAQMMYAGSGGGSDYEVAVGYKDKLALYYSGRINTQFGCFKVNPADKCSYRRAHNFDWFGARAIEYTRTAGLILTPSEQVEPDALGYYLHFGGKAKTPWASVAVNSPFKIGHRYRFDCFYVVDTESSFEPVKKAYYAYKPDGSLRGRFISIEQEEKSLSLKWENPNRAMGIEIIVQVPLEKVGWNGEVKEVYVSSKIDESTGNEIKIHYKEVPDFWVREGKLFFKTLLQIPDLYITIKGSTK